MGEDNENKQSISMSGVSGNKELRVRKVHKKKPVEQAGENIVKKEEQVKAPEVKAEPVVKPVEKPKAEAKAEPKAVEVEVKPEVKKEAKPEVIKEVKAEETSKVQEAAKKAPEAEKKPVEEKPAPKTKVSSAVIAMPDKAARPNDGQVKRTSYSNNRDGQNRFQRNGDGQGRGNYGGQRNNDRGERGGYEKRQGGDFRNGNGFKGNNGGQGSFGKDKDDEDQPRQMQRKVTKPKQESPIDEGKKSRANFAERNAFDKKRTENTENRRDNGKGAGSNDRRSKNDFNNYKGRNTDAFGEDYDGYLYGSKKKNKKAQKVEVAPVVQQITDIQLPPFITVKDFADGIGKKSGDVIKELMKLGILATINQELDFDTACLLADAFGINAEPITEVTEEDILFDEAEDKEEDLKPRPPVVVVMGHVDHGKTSLLDRIRSSSVVAGEAGGITQAIGAYTVRLKGRQITFLDTPGHEAFTTMRARGAQVTDIAILVVAADDGVMPQTIEAINHAKAANTEIIVAINKMDKPGANPDKVKQELANYELIPEEWGGSTIMVPVSAKMGQGIDDLLEMVLLTADVLELKADPKRQAKGTVIEAKLDKARGPVATVLVQRGTLKAGDSVVCGPMIGNIRAMYDDKGSDIKKAGPSIPVEILGLPEVPEAGETLYAVTDDKMARQLVEKRKIKLREQQLHKSSRMSLETLAQTLAEGDVKDLNLIIKADVQGSVEAVIQSLEKLSNDEVRVKVIHGGVGAINESDIVLADVSNAIIIGFNVRPNAIITEKAKEVGVDIRLYSVIYNAIEDVEKAMKGMLAPTFEEAVLGHVEIRELFKVSGVGTIGGSYVLDGKITRNCDVRVVRDDIVVYTGHLASLQRMKDAVKEVNAGYECGLSIENYNDIKIGDVIEAYEMREVER